RDVRGAARLMQIALAADPKNPALLRRTHLLLVNSGQIEDALRVAGRILAIDPKSSMANMLFAVEAAKVGKFDESVRHLNALPKRGGNEILVPLLMGWAHLGRRDHEAAVAAVAPLDKTRGFKIFYQLHTALILDAAGRGPEAEKFYLLTIKGKARPSLRAVQALASYYQRSGKVDKARALFADYLKHAPRSNLVADALKRLDAGVPIAAWSGTATAGMAEALFDVASALQQDNIVHSALIFTRMALYLRPKFPAGLLLAADILEVRGRKEEAIELYTKVDIKSPMSWPARLSMARLYDELDRRRESVRLLERMARERTDDWEALFTLGDIYRSHENFRDAVRAYDRAFKRLPKIEKRHWSLFYARGIALERSKNWKRAEKDLLKAMELRPDHPHVLNYLGYSWADQGINLERAKKMLRRAVELRKRDGYIVDSLGWVLYRTGEYKEAVRQLERAVQLRPQDATINDHLGDAYWKVGRLKEAQFQWSRALSLDPEKAVISTIKTKLRRGLDNGKKNGARK
ncbi:MAG: tetratricopeptide repeat protein, partial [Alphaproteobacteria bacterium]